MPGDSGVTVVTNSRVFYSTREAAGASGARHSLRPLIFEGGTFRQNSGASRRENAERVFAELDGLHFVITRESGRSSIPRRQ